MKVNIEKIHLAMATACMSISDLAIKSNVSRISIGRFINGKTNPRPATIGKIAKALDMPVTDIIQTDAATSNDTIQEGFQKQPHQDTYQRIKK